MSTTVQDNADKVCAKCKVIKNIDEFYVCVGRVRNECKECTIAHNTLYQKKHKTWLTKYGSSAQRRAYMRTYYAKHRQRHAEYRKKFKEAHPDYHKEYVQKRGRLNELQPTPNKKETHIKSYELLHSRGASSLQQNKG